MGMIVQPQNASAQFSIQDVTFFVNLHNLEGVDEIGPDFYQPDTRYNYAFCAAGSSYGAQLWIANDVGNIVETIGPKVDTNHLNKSIDREAGFFPAQLQNGLYTTMQNVDFTTNSTFGDMFQIVEGDIVPIVAQDRDKDGDVDGVDFSIFASCFNKAGNPPRTLGCSSDDADAFDQDGDNDVDGVDFAKFASCFNKAGNPPRKTGCIPETTGPPIIPANNECANATALGEGTIVDNMTSNASSTFSAPDNCTDDAGNVGGDLWYVYTPTCTGSATISTLGTTSLPGPGILLEDSAMAIFTDCPGIGSLITCAESGGGHESITIAVTSGVPVTIAIMGDDFQFDSKGKFELEITCTP
jgi:hypothetical protein